MIRKATNETFVKSRLGASFVFGCLLLASLSSAMVVVSVAYKSRQHVGVLEQLNQLNTAYASELSRLKLEYSTLTEFGRVEKTAAEMVGMKRVDASSMVLTR